MKLFHQIKNIKTIQSISNKQFQIYQGIMIDKQSIYKVLSYLQQENKMIENNHFLKDECIRDILDN